ncbi:DUF885 domain-containing protein [Parvularcula sp. LCG005]|uniref:DUF885 domain-containing protein n=1 Tax=Parvularcula sp. LCG005 TaxID=3078805 RepID=UPI002943F6D0|nr:DUF885 domain-containing protein [Parvularcula sp. LCG005]WOI52652.1 DUF885 domain-containing protein [Parvularcula sp. LCG005]
MNMRLLGAVSAIALLAACSGEVPTVSNEPAPTVTQTKTESVDYQDQLDAISRAFFDEVPESASAYGAPAALAPDANRHLNARSVAAETARRARMADLVRQIDAIDEAGLTPHQKRVKASLSTLFQGAVGPGELVDYGGIFAAYGVWYLPYTINQNSGATVELVKLFESQHAVNDDASADAYVARLEAMGPVLDDVLAKFTSDVEAGAIPPDFIIAKAKAVIDNFSGDAASENVLYTSFVKKLDEAGLGDADYATRAEALISEEILPAYRRISAYLGSIEAEAPHDAGIWRLPNGPALYEAMIRHHTDENLSADELHQRGLDEVERITAEMDALLRAEGYTEGSVGERFAAMAKDPRFTYPDTDEGKARILDDIQAQLDGVNALLPEWFGILPKYDVVVRQVPAFSQDSAPGGFYDPPAQDGSRPGTYWINLRSTSIWPHFSVPTLTYHEAVPGHHMQIAIALDQEVPLMSSIVYSNSSVEGWALYAEALAAEMGLYDDDPFGNIGRLQAELHRAVRLVVDTGMHAKKWSREEAIDYMMDVEGADESDAVSEIERYVVWPGQALGYKVGMLRLQELRAMAEEQLGDDFDIRAFHDEVLKVSSFALPVIDEHITGWIEEKAAQ